MRGILDILPLDIYVNDNSTENIISLKDVADYFHMTMYIKDVHAIFVYYCKYKAYCFKECEKGLYYIDISNP